MNITKIDSISFKSGYPTFGSCGHLSARSTIYDEAHIYPGYLHKLPIPGDIKSPDGILHNVNYLA